MVVGALWLVGDQGVCSTCSLTPRGSSVPHCCAVRSDGGRAARLLAPMAPTQPLAPCPRAPVQCVLDAYIYHFQPMLWRHFRCGARALVVLVLPGCCSASWPQRGSLLGSTDVSMHRPRQPH